MKLFIFLSLILCCFNCFAQSDSLLFRSLEKIIDSEKGVGYKNEIFIAVNKYDLERVKIKDTTLIKACGRDFKVILLKEPSDRKDFYVLPTDFHEDYYTVFRIQNCNRVVNKTFTVSFLKEDNSFILNSFDVLVWWTDNATDN